MQKPDNSEMMVLLNSEAQKLFVSKKSGMAMNSTELDELWEQLLNYATPPVINNDERVS